MLGFHILMIGVLVIIAGGSFLRLCATGHPIDMRYVLDDYAWSSGKRHLVQ